MTVLISPDIKKETARIDVAGNVIDPRTKQILVPNLPEYTPTPEEQATIANKAPVNAPQAPQAQVHSLSTPMSIQQEIEATKQKLVALEELKQLKIQQMKAELELLES